MGQQGLVFVFLPALLLLSAVGLTRLLAARPHWLAVATALCVVVNAGIFLLVPEYPMGPGTQRLLTRATLVNSDHYYKDRFQAIKEGFALESTAILAANWHHVEYYLPGYKLLPIDVIPEGGLGRGLASSRPSEPKRWSVQNLDLAPGTDNMISVIIFDDKLVPFNETPELTQVVELDHGGRMEMFALAADKVLTVGRTFGIVKR